MLGQCYGVPTACVLGQQAIDDNYCPHTHNYCPHTIHLFHSCINSCRKAIPSLQLTNKHIYGLFNLRRIYRQPVRNGQVENICKNSPFPQRGMYPQVANICQMCRPGKLVLIEDCALNEDPCTFVIISLGILLRMRIVSVKSCKENQNKPMAFKNVFPKMVLFYETMWKNITDPDSPHVTIKYGACALHSAYLWLQTHTQNK